MFVRSLCRSSALCFGGVHLSAAAALRRGAPIGAPSFIGVRRIESASFVCSQGATEGDLRIRPENQSGTRSMSGSAGSSATVVPLLTEKCVEAEQLPAVEDSYNGVIVEMTAPMDPVAFVASLRASLLVWSQQEKKGVWIKLPIQNSNLVHPVIQEGFWYHHAEPSYVMLVYWIPTADHPFPVNGTHHVGVGGFVMNDRKE